MYPMHLIKHVKPPFSCSSQLKYRAKHTYLAAHWWCTVHFPQPGAIDFLPRLFGSGLTKSIGNGLLHFDVPTDPKQCSTAF
jgi:hypothetical protein